MKLKKTFLLLALALVSTWAVAQEKIDYSVYEAATATTTRNPSPN